MPDLAINSASPSSHLREGPLLAGRLPVPFTFHVSVVSQIALAVLTGWGWWRFGASFFPFVVGIVIMGLASF
jgi:hypothetical protein